MKISAPIAVLTLLLTASEVAAPQSPSSRFRVGQPFPELVLPSAGDGRPMSIAQYRGKKVLLHIFASW